MDERSNRGNTLVKRIVLYIEGGRNRTKDIDFRQGFNSFFKDLKDMASERNISFRAIPFGARRQAYEKFCYGLSQDANAFHVLLVDSEDPVEDKNFGKCWKHLKERKDDAWDCPAGANDENCHLMVQAMEAWFFADSEKLATYYRQKFNKSALPTTQNVEKIPKPNHISCLEAATKATQKGRYDKFKHAPDLLAKVDAAKVRKRAPHCDRLFVTLAEKINDTT